MPAATVVAGSSLEMSMPSLVQVAVETFCNRESPSEDATKVNTRSDIVTKPSSFSHAWSSDGIASSVSSASKSARLSIDVMAQVGYVEKQK